MRGVAQLSLLALVVALAAVGARAQSNYASHANNIEYQGEGLPEEATLDGRVTRLDDLSPIIALNRTRAALNCAAGSMQVELKFKQPFFGLAYADFDRNSACQLAGNGDITYTLELPLKGCGTKQASGHLLLALCCSLPALGSLLFQFVSVLTKASPFQDPQRVFTNNIVVRFHPGLEMDGDEIITIVCRYPPPVAPPPAALPSAILTEPVAPSVIEPPLKGFHILLIICAILFLSLLLLGLSCSYVCLKKRNIRVVRRAPFSGTGTGTGSEITKLSGSSLGNLSLFEGLRIPRAHAPPAASVSGSEAQLILAGGSHSDTIPSDYPSESPSSAHSEVEDVDTRSLRRPSTVSSAGSYDNKAFLHQEALSSFYSEGYAQRTDAEVVAPPPPEPRFDVSVRVKKAAAPPPPPTPPPSDVESTMSIQARNLTTILEREERRAPPPPPPQPQVTTFSYAPELHPPPAGSAAAAAAAVRYAQTPPVYSRILRRQHEHVQTREALDSLSERSIPDNDNWSQAEDVIDAPQRHLSLTPARSLTSLNTEMTDTRSMSEIMDTSHQRYTASLAPPPPPPPPIAPASYTTHVHVTESADLLEPPVVAERRPEITTHIVDDVFLKTITEKRTIEDVERHRRQVTEYHARPQPAPNPKWDVVIRNYPDPSAQPPAAGSEPGPDWESYSEASSVSGVPTTPIAERHRVEMERSYLTTLDVPVQQPAPPNWDVLIRVLNAARRDRQRRPGPPASRTAPRPCSPWRTARSRQIITTESTLRTLLTEATVREDFSASATPALRRLFEPHKWDVTIRVRARPTAPATATRTRAAAAHATAARPTGTPRSRRSSLPTL
ncbi:Uncharacterized protein GBIM_11896 [Gryllus bimaculatus]|nr:Uncharacterized protein GBIM_11896 [Gryllus bimaculatus]